MTYRDFVLNEACRNYQFSLLWRLLSCSLEPPYAQAPAAADTAAHADELFRSRLENQIDLRHPLAKLASRMPWADLEEGNPPAFSRRQKWS